MSGTIDAGQPSDRHRAHARRLWVSDLIVLACTLLVSELALSLPGPIRDALRPNEGIAAPVHAAIAVALLLLWMSALALRRTRAERLLGRGTAEFRRVAEAGFGVYAVLCAIALLTHVDIARGPLLLGFPTALAALCLERLLWRRRLNARRVTSSPALIRVEPARPAPGVQESGADQHRRATRRKRAS